MTPTTQTIKKQGVRLLRSLRMCAEDVTVSQSCSGEDSNCSMESSKITMLSRRTSVLLPPIKPCKGTWYGIAPISTMDNKNIEDRKNIAERVSLQPMAEICDSHKVCKLRSESLVCDKKETTVAFLKKSRLS